MICSILFLPLLLCLQAYAQVEAAPAKAVEFVKSFYDWYAPWSQTDRNGTNFQRAIKRNPSIFSVELRSGLLSDFAAQSKVSGAIVGIDFDPFLNSQDPAGQYKIGNVTKQGDRYLFHLHAVIDGVGQRKPALTAEVEQQVRGWVFVNFHYPETSDLLSTLRELRESRSKKRGR